MSVRFFFVFFSYYYINRLEIMSSRVSEWRERRATVAAAPLPGAVPGMTTPTGAMLTKLGSLRAAVMGAPSEAD